MKAVYNAFYLLVFLYFLRRILTKVTQDLADVIKMQHKDRSGCFNILVRSVPVFWTYDYGLAMEVARQIREEVPGLQEPGQIEIVEDEDLESQEPERVPGLDSQSCCELGLVINANED